jgi:hypothetical protein
MFLSAVTGPLYNTLISVTVIFCSGQIRFEDSENNED